MVWPPGPRCGPRFQPPLGAEFARGGRRPVAHRRTRSDSVRHAERAWACHSARSAALARIFTHTARRCRFGGQRGHSPLPASAGDARSVAPRSMLALPP